MENVKKVIQLSAQQERVQGEAKKLAAIQGHITNGLIKELHVQIHSPYGSNVSVNTSMLTEEAFGRIIEQVQREIALQDINLMTLLTEVEDQLDPVFTPPPAPPEEEAPFTLDK